jgi:ribosomal protein L11 methyltransferase
MLNLLTIVVPAPEADEVYAALESSGALALVMEDAAEGSAEEMPLFGEPSDQAPNEPRYWPSTRIKAYFDSWSVNAHSAVAALNGRPHKIEPVDADDWVAKTQSQFQPIQIADNFWIVPSWHRDAPPVPIPHSALRIELDPGLAFGTGSHPTTRMCLQWLAAHMPSNVTVLDYGCGSGILSIAARKLGAASVTGVDIDPQAVEAAHANALANACPEIVFALPDRLSASTERFDLVVANILSNPLKVMAPLLASRARRTLVLSGILARQVDEIAEAYAPYVVLQPWRFDEDWVCMIGHHPT